MKFWDATNAMLQEHVEKIEGHLGYLEIQANGLIYRSIVEEYGIGWICWEPFGNLGHFSQITDPNATIKWVDDRRSCNPESAKTLG